MIVHPANVVMTARVACWVDDDPARTRWIVYCVSRHDYGDWGDLDPDDRAANNHVLRRRDGRILSRYPLPTELVDKTIHDEAAWIITDDLDDPDSTITILFPSDY